MVTFEYDALGRRIRKVSYDSVPSVATLYYYDADWRCLEERNGSDTLQRSFIYGNYIDEVLVMTVPGSPPTDYYYLHDHLYSPVALLSSGGSVVERYEYDAYGTAHVFDGSWNTRTASAYSNPYFFQGHLLDRLDNGGLQIMEWRYRTYDTYAGRWVQAEKLGILPDGAGSVNPFRPLAQYRPGMNPREGFTSNPLVNVDPRAQWGADIHYSKTILWARHAGYPMQAASAVAAANLAVDSVWRGISPAPVIGDQSYHFNRNVSGGRDTRLVHSQVHYEWAQFYCRPQTDVPQFAAEQLGIALHPLQDWVAHGDYGMHDPLDVPGDIYTWHNSRSPQNEFGPPGKYPDDPKLDVKDSPDGRATSEYIIEFLMVSEPGPITPRMRGYSDFAFYEKGHKRFDLTRAKTTTVLDAYRRWVQRYGGCRCRRYFGAPE